ATPLPFAARPFSTFIGGAPMKLATKVEAANGSGVALADGVNLAVAAPAAEGEVLVGIRPEDVALRADGDVMFDIQIIEELGAHRLLHGRLAGQEFSVSVPKDEVAAPGPAQVAIKPGAVHFFSADEGRRLS
ncbi:MAG: TOBE domain-containing protein, partial [Pseudomonadota bacterium]